MTTTSIWWTRFTVCGPALVALAVGLAGCAAAGITPGAPADSVESPRSADPAVTRAPAPGLAPYYTQRPVWKACGDGLECANVRVPLDYREPGGRRIEIAVNRLPATETDRTGSLLLNPGGPGGSGLAAAAAYGKVIDRQVRERFDIVGFDPRGVGESTAVRCLSDEERRDVFTGMDADEEQWERFAEGCEKHAAWLLPHVTTENTARDLDVLRAVLGDRKLTYLGWSYGTELGARYAELFPGKVRALVLDSAVDPASAAVDLTVAQVKGFELALRAFVTDCGQAADCPLRRGGSATQGTAEIAALRDRADERPLLNADDHARPVSGSMVMSGVRAALYSKQTWPVLRKALTQAMRDGDGTLLTELGEALLGRRPDGTWSNMMEAGMAIRCADWPPVSREEAAKAAEAARHEAPTFWEDVKEAWRSCHSWPAPRPKTMPSIPDAEGSAPILVIGTLRDPATPYAWSKALVRHLDNAVLLTFQGDGHGAYLMAGSNCIDDAVDRYLLDTAPPRHGSTCPPPD